MKQLLFSNPVFHPGRNITCRRGIKWALETDAVIDGVGSVKLTPRVMRFADVTDSDVEFEHDPACRTADGLRRELERVYPGFRTTEIVTLVEFVVSAP